MNCAALMRSFPGFAGQPPGGVVTAVATPPPPLLRGNLKLWHRLPEFWIIPTHEHKTQSQLALHRRFVFGWPSQDLPWLRSWDTPTRPSFPERCGMCTTGSARSPGS